MNRPALDTSATPRLRSTTENALNPTGTRVGDLLDAQSGSDQSGDAGTARGIALTAVDTSLGLWQYSLDGHTWLTLRSDLIDSGSAGTALLLGAEAQLRLLPFGELSGRLPQAITYRAWNGELGTQGQYLPITGRNADAFSRETETARLDVDAVNDAPSFNVAVGGGTVRPVIGDTFDLSTKMLVQPDGKLVLVGSGITQDATVRIEAIRLDADGQVDETFGNGGLAVGQFGSAVSLSFDAMLQADGKIVVGGYYVDESQTQNGGALRFNADGSIDLEFGRGGQWTDPGHPTFGLTLQGDGKIVLGGRGPVGADGTDSSLVRLTADGRLDVYFGLGGRLDLPFAKDGADQLADVVIQRDGRLLAAGNFSTPDGDVFGVARFHADGTLDTSFGNQGVFEASLLANASHALTDVVLQADGKILLLGIVNDSYVGLVRLNSDGTPDNSFDKDGKSLFYWVGGTQGNEVAIHPDGKIVVSGTVLTEQGPSFAVMRMEADGSDDLSFGSQGLRLFSLGAHTEATTVALQPDGKIVVAGYGDGAAVADFAIVRLNADGSNDESFGGTDRTSLEGGTEPVAYVGGSEPVVIAPDAQISDVELDARGNGLGNYAGARLDLRFHGAEPLRGEIVPLGDLVFEGSEVLLAGVSVGIVHITRTGTLSITFGAQATHERVNSVLQALGYDAPGDAVTQDVRIDWIFHDGNLGDQGTGSSKIATGWTLLKVTGTGEPPSESGGGSGPGSNGGNTTPPVPQIPGDPQGDTSAPAVVSLSPTGGATAAHPAADIVVTFNESIQRGTGSIVLRDGQGRLVERFDAATSDRLVVQGNQLTIDPTVALEHGVRYTIESDAGVVTDLAGNRFGKVALGAGGYAFTTKDDDIALVRGTSGSDLLEGSDGNDRFEDLSGVDIVTYEGAREAFEIERQTDGSWHVRSAGEGDDVLVGIERLQFANEALALDVRNDGNDGNAALAARVLGAMYGVDALDNKALVGSVLGYLDQHTLQQGTEFLVSEGIAAELAGGADNSHLIELLLRNVTGQEQPAAERDAWLLHMEVFDVTQAELIELAVLHELTGQLVDLVGLAQQGLAYVDAGAA